MSVEIFCAETTSGKDLRRRMTLNTIQGHLKRCYSMCHIHFLLVICRNNVAILQCFRENSVQLLQRTLLPVPREILQLRYLS